MPTSLHGALKNYRAYLPSDGWRSALYKRSSPSFIGVDKPPCVALYRPVISAPPLHRCIANKFRLCSNCSTGCCQPVNLWILSGHLVHFPARWLCRPQQVLRSDHVHACGKSALCVPALPKTIGQGTKQDQCWQPSSVQRFSIGREHKATHCQHFDFVTIRLTSIKLLHSVATAVFSIIVVIVVVIIIDVV